MSGSSNDRSSRVRSFFNNDIFLDELRRIRELKEAGDEDENTDIEVIKLRKRWKLSWDYHETITNYIETGSIDYSLGDADIRVIDYKSRELYPSDAPGDEFEVMDALQETRDRGVHIKLPKDLNRTALKDFIKTHYNLIEKALDNNYPDRITHQSPELLTKRKVDIFRRHQNGDTDVRIAKDLGLDQREVRRTIKEFKDRISE